LLGCAATATDSDACLGRRGLASRSYRKSDVINVWPNVCLETIGILSPGSLMRAAIAHSMVTSSLLQYIFFVFQFTSILSMSLPACLLNIFLPKIT
jgi:hypothetical protein